MFQPATGIAPDGTVQFGNDANLLVFFFPKAILHEAESRERGLPIYKQIDYIHIQQPGERDFIEKPADELVKRRFSALWQKYQEGKDQTPDGTPIDLLFPQHPEVVATLKHLKVLTVQQLAHLTEEGMQRLGMGARQWVEMAKQFLGTASAGKEFHALHREIELRDSKIATMGEQIAALQAAVNKLMAAEQKADPIPFTPNRKTDFGDWQTAGKKPGAVTAESEAAARDAHLAAQSGPLTFEPLPIADDDEAPPAPTAAPTKPRGRPRKAPFGEG